MLHSFLDHGKYFKYIFFIETIYLFFLCSTVSNAGYSISYALLIICMFFCLIYRNKKDLIKERSFFVIYIVFMASLFIAAVLSGDKKSFDSTIKYIYWTIPFFVMYIVNKKIFFYQSVQWGTSLAAILLGGYSIIIFLCFPHGERITAFFSSPNDHAMVAEMFTPFIIMTIWKIKRFRITNLPTLNKFFNIFFIFSFFISVIGILLTKSRGGITGFIFGVVVIIVLNILFKTVHIPKIRIIVSSIILCLIAGAIISIVLQHYQRSYDYERILLFKSSYAMWYDHKLYGVGFSRWQEEYKQVYILPEAKEPNLSMPHNTFAEFFSTTGLIGGVGYSFFVFGSIIILIKKMKEDITNPYVQALLWVSISILVHGLVDAGLRNKFVVRLYFAFWGITLASIGNWQLWKEIMTFQVRKLVKK